MTQPGAADGPLAALDQAMNQSAHARSHAALQQTFDASHRASPAAAPVQLMKKEDFVLYFDDVVLHLNNYLSHKFGERWENVGDRERLLTDFLWSYLEKWHDVTDRRAFVRSSQPVLFDMLSTHLMDDKGVISIEAEEFAESLFEEPVEAPQSKKRKRGDQKGPKAKRPKKEIESEFRDSDVGDTSDEEVEEVNRWHLDKETAPSSGATTVSVGDTYLSGAELIALADAAVREVIDLIAGNDLPEYEEASGSRVVESGADWLKAAGTMDKMISAGQRRPLHKGANFLSMEHPIAPRTGKETGSLAVGKDRSKMQFGLYNKMVRVSPTGGFGLEYEDLAKQLGALRDKHQLTDSDMAVSLLQLIRAGELPAENPMANDAEALTTLHFANTLGVGMEGSRLNENIFQHVEVLQDVFAGELSLEEAFFRAPFGGVFPMATTGAKNQEGQIAGRRAGLIESSGKGARKRPRGREQLWEKESERRGGRVASMKKLRAAQQSHPVILKEAQNLARLARRLRDADQIDDKGDLENALKRYIRGTMFEYFGGAEQQRDEPAMTAVPRVRLASFDEAVNRGWNAGDRFEIEGQEGMYYVVLKPHIGETPFMKGDLWMRLKGG